MRILFYGDSITDMGRTRDTQEHEFKCGVGMGMGYAHLITADLSYENPGKHEFINRGVGGNRVVDLYARIKADCWNYKPDLVSILVGINDTWPKEFEGNGVELERYEKIYRIMVEDTIAKLPNVKIILCEPFMLEESAPEIDKLKWTHPQGVREHAKAVKKIAEEYGLGFVALQDKFLELAAKNGADYYLYDGVHPAPAGAKLIATEWLKVFNKIEK